MTTRLILIVLLSAVPLAGQETFLTVKRTVRVTDGIGRGETPEAAKEAAIANARQKALERVATSFVHTYERAEGMVLTEERIMQDIHAKILRTRVRKVEYPFPDVALVTADITVQYFDLDFFVRELRKSAESAMVRSLVVSGWGQVYNRNYLHAVLCFGATYGSLAKAWFSDLEADRLKREYLSAVDPVRSRVLYDRYKAASWERLAWISLGAASWAYSVWEAFENREEAARSLDTVHARFFPEFRYVRQKSSVQAFMDNLAPTW